MQFVLVVVDKLLMGRLERNCGIDLVLIEVATERLPFHPLRSTSSREMLTEAAIKKKNFDIKTYSIWTTRKKGK